MMMRALRKGIWAGAIILLVLVGGCGGDEAATDPLKNDWGAARGQDASCRGDGVYVADDHYDLNADGRPEAFLIMRCDDKKDPQWHLLEVVPGGSDPVDVDPFKLVLQTDRASIDQLCFTDQTAIYRYTVGGVPTVKQVRWAAGAPKPVEITRRDLDGCPSPVPPAAR